MALSFSLFSAVSLSANAVPSSGDGKQVLNIQQWETNQGVPVYFVQTPELPMLDVDVIFNAGSSRDDEQPGIAQFTASMLDEGAGDLSIDQIVERFDDAGAIYSVSVNQDMAIVGFRSLTEEVYLKPALETFVTVLTNPKFPSETFDRLQKQMLISIERMKQSPKAVAGKAFAKALFGDQPYGHLSIGTTESVSKLTPKDTMNFYKKYYVAKNARIVIVGDLTLDAAKEKAERIVANLPEGEAAKPIPDMLAKKKPVHQNIEFPAQQTTIYMGQIGVKPNDPDYFPLMLGNHILGGPGLVSRLFEEVREQRGLVYGVGSRFASLAARGSFAISLQTRNEEAENAIALTRSILKDFVENGPTKKELEAAKKNIIGSFPLQVSSNSDIVGQLVYLSFYGLRLDFLDTYRENIEKVTSAQIRDAFQKHINPEDISIVTVGESVMAQVTNVAKKTS